MNIICIDLTRDKTQDHDASRQNILISYFQESLQHTGHIQTFRFIEGICFKRQLGFISDHNQVSLAENKFTEILSDHRKEKKSNVMQHE